jgi:hypothetical protein
VGRHSKPNRVRTFILASSFSASLLAVSVAAQEEPVKALPGTNRHVITPGWTDPYAQQRFPATGPGQAATLPGAGKGSATGTLRKAGTKTGGKAGAKASAKKAGTKSGKRADHTSD